MIRVCARCHALYWTESEQSSPAPVPIDKSPAGWRDAVENGGLSPLALCWDCHMVATGEQPDPHR